MSALPAVSARAPAARVENVTQRAREFSPGEAAVVAREHRGLLSESLGRPRRSPPASRTTSPTPVRRALSRERPCAGGGYRPAAESAADALVGARY